MPRRAASAGKASPAAGPTRHGYENADHPRSGGPSWPGPSRQARSPRQPSSSQPGPAEAEEDRTRCQRRGRPARPHAAPPPPLPGRKPRRGVVHAQALVRHRDAVAHLLCRRRPGRGWAARAENAAFRGTARRRPRCPTNRSRGRARPTTGVGVPRRPLERRRRPVVPAHLAAGPHRAPSRASGAAGRGRRRAFPHTSTQRSAAPPPQPGAALPRLRSLGSSLRRAGDARAGSGRPR